MKFTSVFLYTILIGLFYLLNNCTARNKEKNYGLHEDKVVVQDFQQILDSVHVTGTIVIYSNQDSTYYSNDFNRAHTGKLPASTFKIPNSIIALETGIIRNDSTICPWDGSPRGIEVWEQDLLFRNAFRYSCVPCYQEIARQIGPNRMNTMLVRLNYPGMDVVKENIDEFWLQGDSRITAVEQFTFLKRLYNSSLAISSRTDSIIKDMMIVKKMIYLLCVVKRAGLSLTIIIMGGL